jgi:hypothetical protein
MRKGVAAWVGLSVLTLILAACGSIWSRANVGALQSDLDSLLAGVEVDVQLQECSMVGSTRSGFCRFQAKDGAATAIIEGFNLLPVNLENATIPFIDAEFEAGCGSYAWILDGSGGELHIISGRPQSLTLSSETRFEYMLLVYESSSGEACVQVSYAYG